MLDDLSGKKQNVVSVILTKPDLQNHEMLSDMWTLAKNYHILEWSKFNGSINLKIEFACVFNPLIFSVESYLYNQSKRKRKVFF